MIKILIIIIITIITIIIIITYGYHLDVTYKVKEFSFVQRRFLVIPPTIRKEDPHLCDAGSGTPSFREHELTHVT